MSARQRRRRSERRKEAARGSVPRRKRVLAGAGITLGVGLGLTTAAQAAPQTFTVGTATDDPVGPPASDCATASNTDCTLRDAILAANGNSNPTDQDLIVFASTLTGSATTITLGASPPYIRQAVYIQGPGTTPGISNITVDGNDSYRDFIAAPGSNDAMNLTIAGINVTGGASTAGAGIRVTFNYLHTSYPQPSLTVKNSQVSGNTGDAGAGIYAFRASVTVQNSDISGNTATGANFGTGGGGIYLFPGVGGTLAVDDSTIENNVAHQVNASHATGGGVHSGGPTTIQDSTISGNYTDGAHGAGGGLYISTGLNGSSIQDSTITGNYTTGQFSEGGGLFLGAYGDMDISGATIADNYTTGLNANGGGIALHASSPNPNNAAPTIENSTIADNYTAGSGASGGGMFIYYESSLDVANATITGNSTVNFGGGIYEYGGNFNPSITNSILSNGSAGQQGPELYTGSHTSGDTTFQVGFSLIENQAGAAINTTPAFSNLTGVDPQLGTLQNNGGPTFTQAPALTSPVIDCGTSAGATTDQRGGTFARPVELARTNSTIAGADGSDMGAVEVQSGTTSGACTNNVPPPPPPSGGGTPTPTPAPKKCKKKKHKSSAQIAKKKCKKKKKK
jgi:hypothetical protein